MASALPLIQRIKKRAINMDASDIFFSAGSVPACKVHGKVVFFDDEEPINSTDLEHYLLEIMSEAEKKQFLNNMELDFSLKSPGEKRFRVNAIRQLNGISLSFRVIPKDIPSFEDLDLPEQLKKIANLRSGLVLLTGSMGSGKTTTLAALVDLINKNHEKRIITVEDPVEFIHQNDKALVEQRDLKIHTKSFHNALRSALRQGADVVLVGELRDLESIALAITAAETGTLVLSTVHTNGAANTVNRLVDVFPYDQQNQIQSQLAQSLKAVVWQTLIPRKDKEGRIAAFEILFQNYATSNLIREGKSYQLNSVIETSQAEGMISMKKMLDYLVKENYIEKEELYKALPEAIQDM